MNRSILLVTGLLLAAACDRGEPEKEWGHQSNEAYTIYDTQEIEWRRLPENSFGYSREDEGTGSTTVERCWPSGKRYRCLVLLYNGLNSPGDEAAGIPATIRVETNRMVMAYSHYRDTLERTTVHANAGYSCRTMEAYSPEDFIGTSSNAEVRGRGSMSRTYVEKFFADNDPKTEVVYFNCQAVNDMLRNGKEFTLLTTAMTAERLNIH